MSWMDSPASRLTPDANLDRDQRATKQARQQRGIALHLRQQASDLVTRHYIGDAALLLRPANVIHPRQLDGQQLTTSRCAISDGCFMRPSRPCQRMKNFTQ